MSNMRMNIVQHRHAARGFTLVELMVAITVALFLLGGLFATVQSTRRSYGNQSQLAQLQDNQRLAMTMMSTVVESTGYYPNPLANVNALPVVFPADALFATAGQTITGSTNTTGPGDKITVRYSAALNDNVYNCIGGQNTTVNTQQGQVFENTFHIVNNALVCTLNGIDYPLVTKGVNGAGVATLGVTNMTILYGVKANPADTGSCADTYLTGAQVTAAGGGPPLGLWNSLCSVSVTLTFINPITPTGPGITINKLIAIMATAGVNS